MTEIITALRNMAGGTGSTGADLVTLGQNHIREILAHIDAQAAEIERLRAALSEIHGQFIPGSRKLYTTPDAVLDSIRATAATALKEAK